MYLMKLCVYILLNINIAYAIPIDNGVLGEAEIECASSYISITLNTLKPFQGLCVCVNI
jgi:hypothetical protein